MKIPNSWNQWEGYPEKQIGYPAQLQKRHYPEKLQIILQRGKLSQSGWFLTLIILIFHFRILGIVNNSFLWGQLAFNFFKASLSKQRRHKKDIIHCGAVGRDHD